MNLSKNNKELISEIIIKDNLKIKTPIPFDNDWDISKISEGDKTRILISKFMYTELLEEILKNEINLNVIIDKDNDFIMIYKNDNDKYIQMSLKDIIVITMYKLNKILNSINKNDKNTFDDIIKFSYQMINKKYIDYQNIQSIQDGVYECISNIYINKKEEAMNVAKNIFKKNSMKGY